MYYRGSWAVENTYSDYKPLKPAQQIGRHFIWGNKIIPDYKGAKPFHNIEKHCTLKELCEIHELPFDTINTFTIKSIDKKQMVRNCVNPELGLHIFKSMNNQELKLDL